MIERRWVLGVALMAVLLPVTSGAVPLATATPDVDAQRIGDFFWWMAVVAAVVWFAALGLLAMCLRTRPGLPTASTPRRVVVTDAVRPDARGPAGGVLAN